MGTISKDRARKLRFFSSIRTKFALTYAFMIAVVLVLMNTYFLTSSRDIIFDSKRVFLQSQASIIVRSLEEYESLNSEDVAKVVPYLELTGVAHITITDPAGTPLYTSAETGDTAENEFTETYLARALTGYDVFYSKFADGTFSSSAFTPVMNRGNVIGAVYVLEDDSGQGLILVELQNTIKNISIIVVVLSIVMIAFMLWTVMRRITSILRAIVSVREGEYNYRIKVSGGDELAMLGDEFNSLTDRLRSTDEIRRRFVANASHELKTPLASIRLLSDSILQNEGMPLETIQEFISDIGVEAERLARTTEKLMSLARLDSNAAGAQAESVDVAKVVVSTLRMLRPLADRVWIELFTELGSDCLVLATEDAVHQVVFNLVENAIKYNKPGGRVTARLEREAESVLFTVDDTGVGVPEEDMPHIFDRFYRVDKARSREAGGSGLGLSIVRDTVRELGGSVSAARLRGGGMRFRVRFALHVPDVGDGEDDTFSDAKKYQEEL